MAGMPNGYIDLTVTSPPYDNLRDYNGYSFDFESIAKELYRVTKQGGVVVWIVGDQVVNGSESGTSFRQALYFKELGFKLHDTMIYQKNSYPFPPSNRYYQQFEYMFVLSKGKPNTTNIQTQDCKYHQKEKTVSTRNKDGTLRVFKKNVGDKPRKMDNIWLIDAGYMRTTKDKIAYNHPAIFPDALAERHILSWSNECEIVFDPFSGSGTTAKMSLLNNRFYIGSEMSKEYCEIAKERIASHSVPSLAKEHPLFETV